MATADPYLEEGNALEKTDPKKSKDNFIRAWRLYSVGRWPTESSPQKKIAYAKAIEALLDHARFIDPPLEIVRIPFDGKEIIGYMRLPKNATGRVPMVVALNGLDSRKEDLAEKMLRDSPL